MCPIGGECAAPETAWLYVTQFDGSEQLGLLNLCQAAGKEMLSC